MVFVAAFALILGVALVAGGPIVLRVRRLGIEARQAASDEYRSTISVAGRDELSALAFAFNEAGAEIRRRATDTKDREDSLRRYIASTTERVTGPLADLERRLGGIDANGAAPADRLELRAAVADAHTMAMRLQNLAAAATLRMTIETPANDVIDLSAVITRVIDRQAPFAQALGVAVAASPGNTSATAKGDAGLVEQALNNLVDNAIRYNREGGRVNVTLDRTSDGRFALRVADDGPGVPDDVLSKLNANRRFRGDEGRSSVPGELGLGLAVVREVGDRFGMKWAFRRSSLGWFEAELTGPIAGEEPRPARHAGVRASRSFLAGGSDHHEAHEDHEVQPTGIGLPKAARELRSWGCPLHVRHGRPRQGAAGHRRPAPGLADGSDHHEAHEDPEVQPTGIGRPKAARELRSRRCPLHALHVRHGWPRQGAAGHRRPAPGPADGSDHHEAHEDPEVQPTGIGRPKAARELRSRRCPLHALHVRHGWPRQGAAGHRRPAPGPADGSDHHEAHEDPEVQPTGIGRPKAARELRSRRCPLHALHVRHGWPRQGAAGHRRPAPGIPMRHQEIAAAPKKPMTSGKQARRFPARGRSASSDAR